MPDKKAAPKPEPTPTPEPEESGQATVTREVNGNRITTTGSTKAEAGRTLDAYVKAHNL